MTLIPKLSILIIGISFPPETFLHRLINGLANKNVDVWLSGGKSPPKNWLSTGNRHWVWSPSWNIPGWRRFLNLLLMAINLFGARYIRIKRLLQLVRNEPGFKSKIYLLYKLLPIINCDQEIVYFPWVYAAEDYIPWFESNGQSVIVSLRGSMVNVYPFSKENAFEISSKLSAVLNSVSAVHCVSRDIEKEGIKFGLDIEKSKVIRPAVDPIFFSPDVKSTNNNRIKLITTGSLIWIKGYEYLLLALKALIEIGIDAELHIIGEGDDYGRILYTSEDLGLEENVFLHGKLPPEKVRDILQTSDIFVLSSLSEGISNAVLEAMSCGLPIVTTDCGGMREAVTDGIEGFVVPVREPKAMANAIEKLAKDVRLRKQMGKAGRQRILKEFVLDDQVDAFINLFQSQLTKNL